MVAAMTAIMIFFMAFSLVINSLINPLPVKSAHSVYLSSTRFCHIRTKGRENIEGIKKKAIAGQAAVRLRGFLLTEYLHSFFLTELQYVSALQSRYENQQYALTFNQKLPIV